MLCLKDRSLNRLPAVDLNPYKQDMYLPQNCYQ